MKRKYETVNMNTPSNQKLIRQFALLALLIICEFNIGPVVGQSMARSNGLEVAWRAQVDVPRTNNDRTQLALHVSDREFTKSYEVVYDGGSRLFTPQQVDRSGRPLGESGAAKMADVEVRVLKTRGVDAEIVEHATPRITVFVQSSEGILYDIDGESGAIRWQIPVGRADFPNLAPAANDDYAAIINGSTLYVISLVDGKLSFSRRLSSAPGAGPVIANGRVFVPLIGGMLEGFQLDESASDRFPIKTKSLGNTQVRPVVAGESICWPTNRGYLYAADAETGQVRFRMEARSDIVASAAFLSPDRILTSSIDGYVFCVNEQAGNLVWQFSTGESLDQSPFVAGNTVLVVSSEGNMFAIDGKTGAQAWKTQGIGQIISANKDRVFCVSIRGRLLTLDLASGSRLSGSSSRVNGNFLTNTSSDRLYLLSPSGQLVCLRQQNQIHPVIHLDTTKMLTAADDSVGDEQPEKDTQIDSATAEATVEEDPFAADSGDMDEEDPFGGEEEDAFGDDPFAGDDTMEDDELFEDDSDDVFGEDEEF